MKKSMKSVLLVSALAAPLFLLSACGGGGSSSGQVGAPGSGGVFFAKQSYPANNGLVYLNQSIGIEFTQDVDLTTVDLNTWSFDSFDASTGQPTGETVIGKFKFLVQGAGKYATENKRIVEFLPAFPTNETFDNGGFRPGRRYAVSVNGGNHSQTPVVRSTAGQLVNQPFSFSFVTPTGSDPAELFYDEVAGGPIKADPYSGFTGLFPSSASGEVGLNFFLAPGFEQDNGDRAPVTLIFNQPLNPSAQNFNHKRIYLEYMDPGLNPVAMTKLDTELELVENVTGRSIVTLTPNGVLPSNATIYVIVERELQDLSGESNAGDPAYNRIFGTFDTIEAAAFQYDAIVEHFGTDDILNAEAAFMEPLAEVKGGALRASFDFGGESTIFDFEPTTKEVILNTDFTQVVPKQGVPYTVSGGVFLFRNITIPENIKVRGQGSNPLVFIATGDVIVKGHISVDGGAGSRVDTLNSANFATPGGNSVCGGGKGGQGSPETIKNSKKGENGFGPGGKSNGGGKGGHSGSTKGAGGGGGSMATMGDFTYTGSFTQKTGKGGNGSGTDRFDNSGVVDGGNAGKLVFLNTSTDDDFWGRTVLTKGGQQVAVTGELNAPIGGAGGGGGGDRVPSMSNFISDNKGGGGGAGGGILIIKALGRIRVTSSGKITADGGHGGGGEQAGGCNQGGGGAGGSGGMIVLMSATRIIVENHGGSTTNGTFGVSADGGIGTTGSFGSGGNVTRKYPPTSAGAVNRGAMGGLGLIQFMVPNPSANLIYSAGDVKPAPVKLPASYGYLSRAQSKWINTAATVRQSTKVNDPRYLDNSAEPGKYGPEYSFSAINTSGVKAGYIKFTANNSIPNQPVGMMEYTNVFSGLKTVTSVTPAGSGSTFHQVDCIGGGLGGLNTLRGNRLQILDGATSSAVKGEWLVVGNTDSKIYLASDPEVPFSADLAGTAARPNSFNVVKKYFEVWSGNEPGLPMNSKGTILASVKIGFAACAGFDANGLPIDRYPSDPSQFATDLESVAGKEAMWKGTSGVLPRPYIMFDVLFNTSFSESNPAQARGSLDPDQVMPELRYLTIPFRF